ncbi:uncharacterized protein LOC105007653 isoform X4 [Esox lucius]|uniref:uncharacterized protein LOC105007653 isoform X4 n=1 Tax=Esox lucius TaxID=8010 RepID=UPI0010BD8E3E|nr:uncharacterized protein LOC105007653 isoform X4 [Esox lucius]
MNNCSHAKDFSWMENGTLVKVEGEAVTVRESPSVKEEDAVIEEMTVTDNLSGVEEEIGTDTPNTNSLQISLTVSEEEVPSEQQHCKREWSPSLGQEDPQPGQIKEEPKELWIGQEREQLQGLFEDFIFTPPCVKSERQKDSLLCEPILAGFPTLRRLEISKLESFRVLFNDHLTVSAAVEVFEAIEKRIAKYEEENDLFRRLMRITPETKPCETDVPAEQQHCKRGWNSSLGQEDPEPTQIKEGQKELRIGQDEEPFFDSKDLVFPLPCVKNDCDQKDPCQKFPTLNQLKISKLRSFCVLFNAQAQAAEGVFRVVEKMLTEYQRENDWLRRMLWITPEIRLCRIDSLQISLTVSEEEVPSEQQHCKREWSPSLGQEDPQPGQIKEEPKELWIGQEREQLQGLFDTKDFIFAPPCVKSERQKDSLLSEPISAGFPTLSRLEISKLESFRVLFNDHLTVSAAVEVFGAVEKRIAKYEEENYLFRRLMRITPETKPCETDALQLFLAVSKDVPAEQQHCKRGWNSSLGQEDPEPTQIKEGQKELRIGQDEEPFFDSKDLVFPLPCVKNDCDQKDPCQKFPTLNQLKISKLRSFCVLFNAQAQAAGGVFRVVEKMLTEYQRENDWLRRMLWITPEIRLCRIEVTPEQHHCKQEWSPSLGQEDPEPTQIKEERHIGQEVEPVQQLFHDKCVKRVSYQEDQTSIMLSKNHYHDKGKMFALKADLQGRVTAPKERPIECIYCRKCYNSTSKLKAHVRLLHRGKPCPCKYCGKPFKHKGDLSKHMRSHTGEKPFSCGDCGKSFSVTKNLTRHKLIHTGEKPFHCDDCGLNFSLKRNLNRHQLIHTGEKPFKCDDCGRSFRVKESLTDHMRTHTGEKPLRCGECGNSFNYKQALKRHMLTHSRETKL